jgi:hypothetical protein
MNPVLFVSKDDGLLNACIRILRLSSTEAENEHSPDIGSNVYLRNTISLYPFYTLESLFQVLVQSTAPLA